MSEETKAPWFGTGLGTDMSGDFVPGTGKNSRFWMPKGSERKIIFLTEGNKSPGVWEHQVNLRGNWQNWYSCFQMIEGDCPLCGYSGTHDGMYRRYKVQMFTVIDTHEFKDRSGATRKNLKKILAAKKDTTEILNRKYLTRLESDEGLKGAMFKVYRGNSDKSCNVGDDFEFVKMVDLESITDTEEFNFVDLFTPDQAKLKNVVKELQGEEGPFPGGTEGTDSKVEY